MNTVFQSVIQQLDCKWVEDFGEHEIHFECDCSTFRLQVLHDKLFLDVLGNFIRKQTNFADHIWTKVLEVFLSDPNGIDNIVQQVKLKSALRNPAFILSNQS